MLMIGSKYKNKISENGRLLSGSKNLHASIFLFKCKIFAVNDLFLSYAKALKTTQNNVNLNYKKIYEHTTFNATNYLP